MRKLLLVLLTLVASAISAAEPRRYAALSLIGNELELVVLQGWTGSNLPQVRREKVKLSDSALDKFVLLEIDDLIREKQPDGKLTMMVGRDPNLYAIQDRIVESNAELADLLPLLTKLTEPLNVTHLILVSKYRHEALLRLARSSTGQGMLTGIGFYIDYNQQLRDVQTGDQYSGYLATYGYFRVSVVDLSVPRIVREERVLGSLVHPSSSAKKLVHPWESATEKEKTQMLQYVLRSELARVLPALLRE